MTDQDGFSESSEDSDTNMSDIDVRGTTGYWTYRMGKKHKTGVVS